GEQIATGHQNRLNRVRDVEARWNLCKRPSAVASLDDTSINERRDELLDEEGVAFGALHHEIADRPRDLDSQQLAQQFTGIGGLESVQPHWGRSTPGATPRRPPVEHLRACCHEQKERTPDLADQGIDQTTALVLRPVDLFD